MDAGASSAATSANEQRKRSKDGISEEAPRVKRQRVSRACDQCRAGREKCDGIKPICGTCSFTERNCTYDTQAKKRGIQPGYIRTLELSLAWLFSKHPDAEQTLQQELAIKNSPVQKLLSSKEGSESDRLHSRWGKGIVCKQIDQLLSGTEVSSPSQFAIENSIDKTDDILADIFPAGETVVPQGHGSTEDAPLPSVNFCSPPSFQSEPNLNKNLAQDPSVGLPADGLLYLPSDFWRLLDIYYSFTHSWLPISEKHDMLKAAYSYPSEGFHVLASDVGSGNHAELWAIFALSAHQVSPRKQQDEIDSYMSIARKLISDETGPFELGHVRALILLSLIYVGRGEHTSAWILIGMAIRIALDLRINERIDLHLPRRKHVFLACYAIEATIGRLHVMPIHLKGYALNVKDLLEEDGLEEWNPWDGGSSVTPQQRFGLSRTPAQTMSIFNRLLSALREEGDRSTISGQSKSAATAYHGTSGNRQPQSEERRPSAFSTTGLCDSDPWTPQQLNLEIVQLWLRSEKSLIAARDSWPVFIQRLKMYVHSFGAARIPPIAAPLLDRITSLLDPDIREMTLRNMIGSLPHIWRREVPIQAIAFQATPGQDASPASILGDPTISSYRHKSTSGIQNLHPMNPPPLYNNNFNIDSNDYMAFQPVPEILGLHSSASLPRSSTSKNMANVADRNPVQSIVQQASSSAAPAIGYMSQEQSQTADLEAIFEEIAMLDGTRQAGDRPEFMRNLGLGPDLDLSTFFGADYQPSDPLFSYLQSDTYANEHSSNDIYPGS